MDHTYLRYECADTFGLIVSSGSSKGAVSHNGVVRGLLSSNRGSNTNNDIVVTTTGSTITGFNIKTNLPVFKLGHRELMSGGVGTGRSLNSDEVICIDISVDSSTDEGSNNGGSNAIIKVATGWMDGTVRIFDIYHPKETTGGQQQFGVVQTLQSVVDEYGESETSEQDEFVQREPLVLNGHTNQSPIRVVHFDNNRTSGKRKNSSVTRLASGGSDGTVVLWDIVSESGLFRLIGHRGPITDVTFVSIEQSMTNKVMDALISSSADSLVKIWDLQQQCCIQTIASHRGEVTSVPCSIRIDSIQPSSTNATHTDINNIQIRYRLITGGTDGQVRVWAIDPNSSATSDNINNSTEGKDGSKDVIMKDSNVSTNDNICHFIGTLKPPAMGGVNNNTDGSATSTPIFSIQYDRTGKYLGVVRGGNIAKCVDIYRIRSVRQSHQKRQRRLRRRQEKLSKKKDKQQQTDDPNNSKANGGNKRGLLDDPDSSSDDDDDDHRLNIDNNNDDELLKTYKNRDPSLIKASDEYEYVATIRCNHKIRGFAFLPANSSNSSSTMSSSKVMKKTNDGTTAVKELIRVVCALSTNAIDVYSIQHHLQRASNSKNKDDPIATVVSPTTAIFVAEKINILDMYGHPTGIRSIALSSDDKLACTVSKNITKVWTVHNRSCILSLSPSLDNKSTKSSSSPSLYGLCTIFLPGNTHVVVGTREGHLYIVNVSAGDVVHAISKAHDGAIWSIDVKRPPGTNSTSSNDSSSSVISIVTGSADKSVKFWIITSQDGDEASDESDSDNDETTKKKKVHQSYKSGNTSDPMLVHTRTLQMSDDVVAVRYSNSVNGSTKRLLFVSTLDCTIKVFFDDTLKLFLSLYGHKLPALAIDGSDDDTILASGGADKTIKIWGLDFGDTHKTLHGHNDSITDIRFVKRTHYFFTCSKDFTVRYWDGDRFEQILLLNGHSAEVSCLAVSRTGAFVLTGGMDRQIRVWERTSDIVFLQEERERELESAFDNLNDRNESGTGRILDRKRNQVGNEEENDDNDNRMVDNADEPQSEAAVRKSMLAIASGDRIVESLELADQELKDLKSHRRIHGTTETRPPNLMMMGMEPSIYILYVLRTIKSAELEQSLMVLPHTHVERLMYHLIVLLKSCRGIELCSRVAIFIIKTHQNQIIATRSMVPPLRELKRLLRQRVSELRDVVGFDLAALKVISRVASDRKQKYSFDDTEAKVKDIWSTLGLGSDVAAALEGARKSHGKR